MKKLILEQLLFLISIEDYGRFDWMKTDELYNMEKKILKTVNNQDTIKLEFEEVFSDLLDKSEAQDSLKIDTIEKSKTTSHKSNEHNTVDSYSTDEIINSGLLNNIVDKIENSEQELELFTMPRANSVMNRSIIFPEAKGSCINKTPEENYGTIELSKINNHTDYWVPNAAINAEIYQQVSNAKSLEEFKAVLKSIEGYYLKNNAQNTVVGTGNTSSPIMLVGEAPGAEEDIKSEPFVGQSGKLLQALLDFIGLTRDKIYITNIIPWRPPDNRTPTSLEIQTCMPFVLKQIQLIKPKYIMMLGTIACRGLLNVGDSIRITKIHGQWFEKQIPGLTYPVKLLATYHPSFVLRQPRQKKHFWQDILEFKSKLPV